MAATEATDLKQDLLKAVEAYREKNFWNLYPSGKVQDWVFDCMAEYIKPLHDEIEKLKANV